MTAKSVVVGFDVKKELGKLRNAKEKDILQFRDECRTFLKTIVCKLLVRSPLTYSLTKACSSIDPGLINSQKDLAKKRMEKLLSILTNHGQISGVLADSANRQYRSITSKSGSFENFNRKKTRVDVFWRDLLNGENKELFTIIKIVCCLSHGNSVVERGFSINAECLFDNMRDESVVARRTVYDAIAAKGGIENVSIPKSLILRAKNAHSLYVEDIKRRRKEDADGQAELSVKRQ